MKQPRICEVFGGHCDHRDTLLQIPFSIRWRIFMHVGVICNAHIEGLDYFDFDIAKDEAVSPEDCKSFKALMRTCSQLSAEARAFLFSYNTVIYDTSSTSWWLDQLGKCRPVTIYYMRNIYITLQRQQFPHDPHINQTPLDDELIYDWQWAIWHILSNVPSRQLRLHLICQTASAEKAKAVLAPLHHFPGHLLEVELSFDWWTYPRTTVADKAHKKIGVLVREAANVVLWKQEVEASKGFRFLDLPLELRQMVYTYTNLATPYRKFAYGPARGFDLEYVHCESGADLCADENTHWNNSVAECVTDPWEKRQDLPFHKYSRNAYSSRCTCSSSPLALLLTCRVMHDEVAEFLYSYNRLIVRPEIHSQERIAFPTPRKLAETSRTTSATDDGSEEIAAADVDENDFWDSKWDKPILAKADATWALLQRLGPGTARWLRNIEICFPRIDAACSLVDTNPAYREWLMAVAMLTRLASEQSDRGQGSSKCPRLTLVVHICTNENRLRCSYDTPEWAETAPNYSYDQATQLLVPLRPLRPYIRRFFVFLEAWKHWSPPRLRREIEECRKAKDPSLEMQKWSGWWPGWECQCWHYLPTSKPGLARAEKELEKLVMGDDYDAYKLGKGNEIPSPWVRDQYNGFD